MSVSLIFTLILLGTTTVVLFYDFKLQGWFRNLFIFQLVMVLAYITASVLTFEKLLKLDWFTPDPIIYIISVMIIIGSILEFIVFIKERQTKTNIRILG